MMTRNHRQEAMCRAYVQAVAGQAGLTWSRPQEDYGIDLSLRSITVTGNRRRDAGSQLDMQLKSTTRAGTTASVVTYDLDRGAYDDLRRTDCPCPRVLVVLVLPADESQWLSQTPEELTLRHCAYWMSLRGYPPRTAVRSIRVAIPLTNVLSVETLLTLMERVRERKDP